jgi:hypothetical protein
MAALAWTRGYKAAELERAQSRFNLTFPSDLVDLLLDRRPVGGTDWNEEEMVRAQLAWPFEGLLFDVEENGLWWPEWGDRPAMKGERAEFLRDLLRRAPQLIPIVHHRYLPAMPNQAGNPVFSVYQADIIHYGADLGDYIAREEEGFGSRPWPKTLREIDFWSEMVRRNGC